MKTKLLVLPRRIALRLMFVVLVAGARQGKGQDTLSSAKTINTSEYIRHGDTVFYQGSLFTGTAIKKYDNGQIKAEEHYVDGFAHGLWKEWYKTGEKKFEGNFKHGKNDGEWIEWLKDGSVGRKIVFENGK